MGKLYVIAIISIPNVCSSLIAHKHFTKFYFVVFQSIRKFELNSLPIKVKHQKRSDKSETWRMFLLFALNIALVCYQPVFHILIDLFKYIHDIFTKKNEQFPQHLYCVDLK